MNCNFILITPSIAETYLKANDRNYRALSSNRVDLYARDMKEGRWIDNGEPIQIHQDGSIANGQHRLAAIAKSGVSITMLVVSDVPNDIEIYDIGKSRTTNEVARAQGLQVIPSISGIITTVVGDFGARKIGTMEVIEYYKAHSESISKAYNIGCRGSSKNCVLKRSGSLAAIYCALRLKTVTEQEAIDFCTIANSGMPQEGKNSTVPIMLSKTINEGIKDRDNKILGTSGWVVRKPSFEVTYQALIEFKSGKSRNRKRYAANGGGLEILKKVHVLDEQKGD